MSPSYHEVQPFVLLWVVLPLTTALTAIGMHASTEPGAALGSGIMVVTSAVLLAFFGRLAVEIRGDRLHWTFGFLGWPRWSLPLADVERCEVLRRAGRTGAGIRGPARDRLFSVVVGGPALRLALRDGRCVTLGSPDPDRLRRFIDARRDADA